MAGDFYDIFRLPDSRWGIVVADVSDKGAAAAMYMAMTRSLIRMSAANYASPARTLKDINQQLIDHSSSDMFVTVFYAILDTELQQITYANAGQNPPLLRHLTNEIEKLMPTGPALSLMKEIPLTESSFTFEQGDLLVIYTDGVTDALNSREEQYGLERLMENVASAPPSNATLQLAHLSNGLAAFTGDRSQFDDITFFLLLNE
jgi:phosphoserine phosphatase RsbU/P